MFKSLHNNITQHYLFENIIHIVLKIDKVISKFTNEFLIIKL